LRIPFAFFAGNAFRAFRRHHAPHILHLEFYILHFTLYILHFTPVKKVLRVLFFFFLALYVVIHLFDSEEEEVATTEVEGDFDEADPAGAYIVHHRRWNDLDASQRQLSFSVSAADNNASSSYRNGVDVTEDGTEKGFWHNLYFDLYDHDKASLQPLSDSLMGLAARDALQKGGLMYATVSMIQDIQYNYIIPYDSCAAHEDYPCVPLQRYGVLFTGGIHVFAVG
jgi:hypothetical protein